MLNTNSKNFLLLQVDNRNLSLHLDNLALNIGQFTCASGNPYGSANLKCKPVDIQKVTVEPSCVVDACSALLQRQAYKTLIDFDNHLDDISADWTNLQLNDDVIDILKLYGSLG